MKLVAGTVLAERYRLSHRLGQGGMGQVWSAIHLVTGRRVAIKRLLSGADQGDDEHSDAQARARFILEAQAACAVEHPNVVQVLDFIEPGDEPPLLVMELLNGETLASKLAREHVLEIQDVLSMLVPVVSAVGTAHSRGIIHRDLKPANIFLCEAGADRVRVLDFGIAKWVAQRPAGSGLRTQTGSTLGTPCYMAPEQAIGERLITHAVDTWSLGVIFYECLAGARPLEGENAAQVMVSLLNTGIMPIEYAVPELPAELAKLIGQMLSRDRARRPKDLREVFDVLRRHASVVAPAFAEPALEVLESSSPSDGPGGTRASAPPVAWVPKTMPEAASGRPSPTPVRSGYFARALQRSAGWALAGAAILAVLFAASRLFRAHAALKAPDRPAPQPVSLLAGSEPVPVAPLPDSAVPQPTQTALPSPSKPGPAHRRFAVPHSSAAPLAAPTQASANPAGAPKGAACERSRDCASRLCVAFACE